MVKYPGELTGSEPTTVEGFLDLLSQFPEFDNMDKLFHSPKFHPEGDGSLKAHMIAVFEKWLTITLPGQPPAFVNRTSVGFWALVFHDIGKQACADWKGDDKGFHSFIKHESVGADIFVEKYRDLNPTTEAYAEEIEWIIRNHTNFWQVGKYGKSVALAIHPAFDTLTEVCLADKMGQTLPDGRDMDKEWVKRMDHFAEMRQKHLKELARLQGRDST